MGKMQRDKGARWRRAVVAYLRTTGFPYAQPTAEGTPADHGDVTGIGPCIVIEAKDWATWDVGSWLRQTDDEMEAAGAEVGLIFAKRRGHPSPLDAAVIMRPHVAMRLLIEAGYAATTKAVAEARPEGSDAA
jgi:hypothetical protein